MITPLRIDSILHASDFTPASEWAFAHALRLAVACRAELRIAHVDSTEHESSWLEFPGVRRTLAQWGLLPEHARESDVAALGISVEKAQLVGGDTVGELLRMMAEDPVDFAVLATHPRQGWQRWLRPDVAIPLARRSRTATLFVPESCAGFISPDDGAVRLSRILAAVDHAPDPQWVISATAAFLKTLGCEQAVIDVVHVGNEEIAPRVTFPEQPGWQWRPRAVSGPVVERLVEIAAQQSTDLAVVATAGRAGWLDALRGSTSERLIHALPCPILATPVIEQRPDESP